MNPPRPLEGAVKEIVSLFKHEDTTDVLSSNYDLIVFSHLRWGFVYQRPQHILSRLAQNHKVLFIEEPIDFNEKNRGTATVINQEKNITVLQPHISWGTWSQEMAMLLPKYIHTYGIKNPILWFYSGAFVDILPSIEHSLVIYDCMDELSAFKGASKELISQEKKLISLADVVFTGGKSLYESKKKIADNVYCFPSSVDKKHFEKSLKKTTEIPDDIAHLQKPVVGFYGVLDERLDLHLLESVAKAMPEVTFVMIGPVVKINENDLPKHPNIFYTGQRSYKELPQYLKGIDIAMMPFALNESTRFISPTKTLEFMAAHKPTISTPIYDVVRDYQNEVKIVKNAEEFVQAINAYIHESVYERTQREKLQKAVIDKTSWDNTVVSMKKIMSKALQKLDKAKEEKPLLSVSKINLKLAYE